MDPLQKGWSKKKTLWVNEQFNNKLLGENWFRNTPAQAVVESKVPDDNRNDFWYSIYGTIIFKLFSSQLEQLSISL